MERSETGRRLSLAGLSAELTSLQYTSADRGACDDALNAVLDEVTDIFEISRLGSYYPLISSY